MEKLKPCPFCGGEAEIAENETRDIIVICKSQKGDYCNAQTRPFPFVWNSKKSIPRAINAWNRRAGNDNRADY